MSGMTAAIIILLQVSAIMSVIGFIMYKLMEKPFEKYLEKMEKKFLEEKDLE